MADEKKEEQQSSIEKQEKIRDKIHSLLRSANNDEDVRRLLTDYWFVSYKDGVLEGISRGKKETLERVRGMIEQEFSTSDGTLYSLLQKLNEIK